MYGALERQPLWLWQLPLLLAFMGGCSGRRSFDQYVPSKDDAQRALETALAAWQSGKPPGKIESANWTVTAVDSKWQSGQKLVGYRILHAESGSGPVWFTVQLTLTSPPAEQQVRYVVLGPAGQLWVYRDEDFEKISHSSLRTHSH